jgi:multidrug resistance efflux pump
MSRGQDPFSQETVVPFPNDGDTLDVTGQAIFTIIQRAANKAEQDVRHAQGATHRLTTQLLAAQERIAALEAEIGQSREKVSQAEHWMQRIGALVEQRFFTSENAQSNQQPARAVHPQDYAARRQYNR